MDNLLLDNMKVKLMGIFKKRLNMDFDKLGKDSFSQNLLGEEIRLSARDLLYIYFDVKNEFDINIPQEDIAQGKFSTFDGIFESILSQMKQKEMSAC